MSNKNTPTNKRALLNSPRVVPSAGKINAVNNALKCNTPGDKLRRHVMTRTQIPEPKRKSSNDCEIETLTSVGDENEHLNTAFRKSLTPRFKPKATTLNACYTPSSLYRNIKGTPKNQMLPIGTPRTREPSSSSKSKTTSAPNSNDNDELEISNLTVAVRVRPLNSQECARTAVRNIVRVQGNTELTVLAGTTADASAGVTHSFTYDHVFYSCDPDSTSFATQEDVFNGTAGPLIDRAFEGYNACLFAYGQTGSGKSYSMMGLESFDDDNDDDMYMATKGVHAEAGIIPRFCHEIFRRLESIKDKIQAEIEVSYFEIYNEKIHDLLCVSQAEALSHSGLSNAGGTPSYQQRPALKVREHPIWGPYVVDLSVHPVDSYESLRNWLAVGNSQRATAATGMNDKSSRSHSIFNIVLNLTELGSDASSDTDSGSTTSESVPPPTLRQTRRSKISLVDLAGSERISVSGSNCDRIREGVSINKSLLTLGKVIAALSEAKKDGTTKTFVPYRESVLTWLLRECLGGNSKTVMLATISPANVHVDETLATLRYACQARTIVNRVKVNESPHDKKIRELSAEVERLKSLQNEYERQKRLSGITNPVPRKIIIETSVDDSEVEMLKQQLVERERELARAQKSWMERLKEAEDLRKSELRLLRRKGLALELSTDQKQACLVNLTADPMLSGTLFYILPPGVVKIGRTRTSAFASQPDIVLDGPLVGYHHCIIENETGKLFVTPESEDFETYLNGELVTKRQQMFHGDRLVIGGSHYFRISNPFCAQRSLNKLVDFDLAHRELLQKQEDKLRNELEAEKHAALRRIELERNENERIYQERLQDLELQQLKFKCNSEILETERRALEQESNSKNAEALAYTPSYKSTLLDDINRIMQNPSEDSLHRTQLMVKEATQRCRNVGLNFDFRQSKVMDEFGMFRTVVLILDKAQGQKAEWPVARLGVWLDIVRESDNLNAENIFSSVDLEWEQIDNDSNESLSDSLNSSRISLNLSKVKDALLKQPLQKLPRFLSNRASMSPENSAAKKPKTLQQSMKRQAMMNAYGGFSISQTKNQNQTKKMLTYEDDDADGSINSNERLNADIDLPLSASSPAQHTAKNFVELATEHVREMQRSALRLKRLCDSHINERENLIQHSKAEPSVREALGRLENILHGMRNCLEQEQMTNAEVPGVSPTKTPKSVRFLID